jgi:hypothetical protein
VAIEAVDVLLAVVFLADGPIDELAFDELAIDELAFDELAFDELARGVARAARVARRVWRLESTGERG